MDDDFNTAGAIGWMNKLVTNLNRLADEGRLQEAQHASDPHALEQFKVGTLAASVAYAYNENLSVNLDAQNLDVLTEHRDGLPP